MKRKYLSVLSFALLLSAVSLSGCAKEIKINFIGDNGTMVRTIKEGETLSQGKIPNAPQVKGKYCLWDEVDYASLKEDIDVHYTCYDSIKSLTSNLESSYEVEIDSSQADLSYIFRDLKLEATLEDNSVKNLYYDDIIVNTNGYNKSISGDYAIELKYNNKQVVVNIKVKKIDNYVTAVLGSNTAYLNERLPSITANTSVPGTIKFDENQSLMIGTVPYTWTFIPEDTNKYEIIHGTSVVNVINAQTITTNKSEEVMTFDYNTPKQDIIAAIKDGLKVTGKFDNVYREIDDEYYTIDSTYQVGQAGDSIPFRVVYGESKYSYIYVNVKKNENYNFSIDDIDNYVMNSTTTLASIAEEIMQNEFATPGTFSFNSGQTLMLGSNRYSYTFTPDYQYYAPRVGEILINTNKVINISVDSDYLPTYEYNSKTLNQIIEDIQTNFEGKLIYHDGSEEDCDNISVLITDYDPLQAGEYEYTIIYDDVSVVSTFIVNKRKLKEDSDFVVNKVGSVDLNNVNILPECTITSVNNDFDIDEFSIVLDLTKPMSIEGNQYTYYARLEPSAEASENYEAVDLVIVFSV